MKKVKVTTIILAIILISLVSFCGVYMKKQNRMENKVKEYSLGRELYGGRTIELKVKDESEEGETTSNEELTAENYEIVKNTIEKRLKNLGAQDYTISLNKEDGTIRVELPENENTDDMVYYLLASGKVQLKEKDTDVELLSDSMIKKAQYTYKTNSNGEYQIYLELFLTKDGQAQIEEIKNTYAVLENEIDEIEEKSENTDENTETENTEEQTDIENEDTTEQENAEDTSPTTEDTKKIATLTVAGTEYDIDKIEKNKITIKMGAETSNNTSINNNMAKASELSMLINSGKYPIEYEAQNNRFVNSDIFTEQLMIFILIVTVILLIVFIIFIIKYKIKGLIISISNIGFIALLLLILRYSNVIITINGIGAIIFVILINLRFNQIILNKIKTINIANEAILSTYKEVFLKLVPLMIITLVFCFSGWENLNSFGMIMFWGLIIIAGYNAIITKTLLRLIENK